MAEHTLKRFDEELERLSSTISEMGGLAETPARAEPGRRCASSDRRSPSR